MALTYTKDIVDFNRKVKEAADVTELETTVSQLSASLVTVQGDVTELETTVGQLSASMLEVQGDVSTLAGAVTALDGEVEALKPTVVSSFTKDGTTTYAEALTGMYNTNINDRSILVIDYGTQKTVHKIYRLASNLAWFSSSITSGGHAYINTLQVQTSGAVYTACDFNINEGTMSIINESTNVAESMQIINL